MRQAGLQAESALGGVILIAARTAHHEGGQPRETGRSRLRFIASVASYLSTYVDSLLPAAQQVTELLKPSVDFAAQMRNETERIHAMFTGLQPLVQVSTDSTLVGVEE